MRTEKPLVTEKELRPINGAAALLLILAGVILSTALFVFGVLASANFQVGLGYTLCVLGVLGWIVFPIMTAGLKIVRPNEARVLTLFGRYYGTIKRSGFFLVHPFCTTFSPAYNEAKSDAAQRVREQRKQGRTGEIVVSGVNKNISLKTQTLNNNRQKVNDVLGNPIVVGAVVIWRVVDATRAVFAVENYAEFLSIQADSTVRDIARRYPYDEFSGEEDGAENSLPEQTLRGSSVEIAERMREELQRRVAEAGLEILEVQITHLAYAEEIAAAMLQRQQAVAIIAARQKIVDGAVGMVKMAIDKLGEEEVVVLDEERKAAMVSNLLVVLCGSKDAQPVLNSGSIY